LALRNLKLLLHIALIAILLFAASCSDRSAVEFNVDDFPEIKPFYQLCGKYKGVTAYDLHGIQLSFRPTGKTTDIMTALDSTAKKEKWVTTLASERKRCFVKSDKATQIEGTIVVTVSEDGETLQMLLQTLDKKEANKPLRDTSQ